jgi:hypothetical protein
MDEPKRSRCSVFANYSGGGAPSAGESMDYGQALWFYQKKPLTQWLRGRKDSLGALLLGKGSNYDRRDSRNLARANYRFVGVRWSDGVDRASPHTVKEPKPY